MGGGEFIETRGIFERGCLFNLEKTMVSVLHKKPGIQCGNAQVQEVGGHAAEDHNKSDLLVINKQSQFSPHKVLLL